MEKTIKAKVFDEESGKHIEKEIPLNEWIDDPETGERTMYTREVDVNICENHQFNKQHECEKCPFVFTGFRANMHIQTDDGIFVRKPGHKPGRRLA